MGSKGLTGAQKIRKDLIKNPGILKLNRTQRAQNGLKEVKGLKDRSSKGLNEKGQNWPVQTGVSKGFTGVLNGLLEVLNNGKL